MKKVSQSQWNRYLKTDGKEVVKLFESAKKENFSPKDMLKLATRFNPQFFSSDSEKQFRLACDFLSEIDELTKEFRNNYQTLENDEDYISAFYNVLEFIAQPDDSNEPIPLEDIPENQFKIPLYDIVYWSLCFYKHFPKVFIPNLFVMQFSYLKKIAEKYEIELPEVPARSKYFDRCCYYINFCIVLDDFATENNLSQAELCAFLYDYEYTLAKEEAEEMHAKDMPQPSQAWFLVGNYGEGERDMDSGFWQANKETRVGDILIFYEKSPAKSINAMWRALEDGIVDPFFYYYSHTYIGHKLELPPISLEELRNDDYFKSHSLVRKQFQGGSGWPLNAEDYRQLKRIWSSKGFDTDTLPKLKAHEPLEAIDYTEKEAAVHKYQVIPLLADMGWTESNGDILCQVTLHVGHGETSKKGRTDISLHPNGKDKKKAKVVIEEKYWLKNEAEIREAYEQGLSYANLQKAKVLVVCDKIQIVVFQQANDSDFHFENRLTFYWDEMRNPDKFLALKQILS